MNIFIMMIRKKYSNDDQPYIYEYKINWYWWNKWIKNKKLKLYSGDYSSSIKILNQDWEMKLLQSVIFLKYILIFIYIFHINFLQY